MTEEPISPLRRRMIEDMTVRDFGEKTQNDYIRHVKNFAIFLGRSPDTATPEDLRRFQLHQRRAVRGHQDQRHGRGAAVLLHRTLDRPEMARHLTLGARAAEAAGGLEPEESGTADGGRTWAQVQGRAERRLRCRPARVGSCR